MNEAVGDLSRREAMQAGGAVLGSIFGIRDAEPEEDEFIGGLVGAGTTRLQLAPGFPIILAPTVSEASVNNYPSLVFGTDTGDWKLYTESSTLPFMAQSEIGNLSVNVVQNITEFSPDRYPALVFTENGLVQLVTE